MDCPNRMWDEVATESQEEESIDEGLLDRASEEEVEEQGEEVDRAPKRMYQSEDGDGRSSKPKSLRLRSPT